ncbi:cell division protein DivIC [Jejuia pallidilutea]|nr:cell division protein DivIC [Jejuia pallidilutea]
MVPTYPSFKQLKKFELLNINKNAMDYGLKKVRRLGHTMEFEQIKDYVLGDDLRTINWKATAKKNQLMVNQFQDEKSQPVYSIIDKGRIMKMPFNGLSLLDYAINATLVISNIVLKKHDKAGMLSFSKKIENVVVAERRSGQMQLVLEALYNIKTDYFESDFGRLYANIKRHITHRSLLLMYTNFETLDGLNRQLPYLKAIAKSHLLVVVFFKNTEIDKLINNKADTVQQVYDKVIAEKFDFEKRLIVNELKKFGIYSILTTPENLTVDTINKYLEIKARGLL